MHIEALMESSSPGHAMVGTARWCSAGSWTCLRWFEHASTRTASRTSTSTPRRRPQRRTAVVDAFQSGDGDVFLIASGRTVELHHRKRELATSLLDESHTSAVLSPEDLRDLLTP
jgi:hypothetical protein